MKGERILQDWLYGMRTLRKRPLLATIGIVTLALGIGANTLVFSVVGGVLYSALPFPEADRLVGVFPIDPESPDDRALTPARAAGYYGTPMSLIDEWQSSNQVFESMGAYRTPGFTLSGGDRPEDVEGAFANSGVFTTVGANALMGRTLLPEDDAQGAPPVVVLGHALWSRTLGGDPDALGRQLTLNGSPHTVVGVMPPEFSFPTDGEELWANLSNQSDQASNLQVIARLRPDVGVARAQRDMEIVAERAALVRPDDSRTSARVFRFHDMVVSGARGQLLMLLGAVAVVLLIACANLATLLLIRGAERGREFGIRTALGAGRGRLASQLLAESLVLSTTGGLVGCLLAVALFDPFVRLFPSLPRGGQLGVDASMLGLAAGLSLLVGLGSGALPAIRWSRTSVSLVLGEGKGGGGRRRARTRAVLVVTELALAFVLVHSAVVFAKSFRSVAGQDVGFEADGLLTTRLRLPMPYRTSEDSIRVFYQELVRRLGALPGVDAVGGASQMPFTTGVSSAGFRFANAAGPVETDQHIVFATPGYFEALGLPVTLGRAFTLEDGPATEQVALVTRSFATAFFTDEDPIGRQLEITWDDEPWLHTVVGVVEDVRYRLTVEPFPTVYLPFAQRPTWYQSLVLRTSSDPVTTSANIRESVWAMDPAIPVSVTGLGDVILGSRAHRTGRFSTVMVSLLALLAGLLACIGTYGVLASAVSQRRREIGIRMALGATAARTRRDVLVGGLILAGIGLASGIALALVGGRLLASQLYRVSPADPTTMTLAGLVLTVAVAAASTVPAHRATTVSPAESLRE